jgi:hypothetical protein
LFRKTLASRARVGWARRRHVSAQDLTPGQVLH